MEYKSSVLIAGGTGFLGQELGLFLSKHNVRVSVVGRSASKQDISEFSFPVHHRLDYDSLSTDPALLRSFDTVINLAGASVADTNWDSKGRAELLHSRVGITQLLADAFVAAKHQPKLWLQSSAVGYYGDRKDEELNETSTPGSGFLAQLCVDWEASAPQWPQTRVCFLRIAPVLALNGGMMATLDPLYAKGLGANLGKHFFPWIHLDDVCSIVAFCMSNETISGPVNVCAPETIRYSKFHQALAQQKQVPTLPGPPAIVLRLAMREKATFILSSQRVIPAVLTANGFKFSFATIKEALRDVYRDQKRGGLFWLATKQWLPLKIEDVWPFFCDEQNLERITPPLLQFHVKGKSTPAIGKDTLITYRLKLRGLPMKWISRIAVWNPPFEFVDTQIKGPYRFWYHQHFFETVGNGTLITDRVQFQLPLGTFGALVAGAFVRGDVRKIFAFRRTEVPRLLVSEGVKGTHG